MTKRPKTHGELERERQERFRNTSETISALGKAPRDEKGRRHGYLLGLEAELDNLFPGIRKSAPAFFRDRGIKWWTAAVSGDRPKRETGGLVPTRNMASSQIACLNVLLPLASDPAALTALLRSIDSQVETVVPIQHQGRPATLVEFEWVGCCQTLEGGPWRRGAKATSIDALLLGRVAGGIRAYLLEWKYVEAGGHEDKGEGADGAKRLSAYGARYKASGLFRRSLREVLFAPIYQLVRSILLGDRMAKQRELGVTDARTIVVCPESNAAYLSLDRPHARRLGQEMTLEAAMKREILRRPEVFDVTSQQRIVAAVRSSRATLPEGWSAYMADRYGW